MQLLKTNISSHNSAFIAKKSFGVRAVCPCPREFAKRVVAFCPPPDPIFPSYRSMFVWNVLGVRHWRNHG